MDLGKKDGLSYMLKQHCSDVIDGRELSHYKLKC